MTQARGFYQPNKNKSKGGFRKGADKTHKNKGGKHSGKFAKGFKGNKSVGKNTGK